MASNVQFNNYSKEYDNLLKYSTPYIKLLNQLKDIIKRFELEKSNISVLDIGAGTGNISKLISETFSRTKVINFDLIEPNKQMMYLAIKKMEGLKAKFHPTTLEDYQSQNKYDVIVCIHALYLMNNPSKLVCKFKEYMHKDSILIICDIGSEIKVKNWFLHLLITNTKEYGLIKTLKILFTNNEVKNANREIARKQKIGTIWSHTLLEFEKMFSIDYNILEKMNTFHGCSNLLVCKKKADNNI